jgi:CubicO group peptidase (beta-lactamase class C family)
MQTTMKTESSTPAASSAAPDSQIAAAQKVLTDAIAARAFPGCAFGVLANNKVVLEGSQGRSTYDDGDGFAIAAETVYDVASITKVVATTAAAMLLFQQGVLDLDTPLGELLPGFVVGRSSGERARHVKMHHLLAHNSGLPGYVEMFRTSTTPDALLRACLQQPLEAEPGARAEYSDIGFILLGKALEVLIRESLATWVDREVLRPLGMTATGFNPPSSLRPLIPPTEEDREFRQRRIQGEVQDEHAYLLRGVAGHAGLFSNVPDLLSFAGEILSSVRGSVDPARPPLFSKATVERFAELQGPDGSSRALGWDTPSKDSSAGHHFSAHSIGHLGFSGCSLWIDLEASMAVVLLTNRTWPNRQSQLIREVRPAFHDAVREALDSSRK